MSQTYSKHISAYVTPEMYQFLQLLAERHRVSVSDVVRQAIREHLDEQEDVMSSRSRLGRTVMRRLETMHHELLKQLTTLSKLLLAAILILLAEQGIEAGQATKRILNLASQPALDKLVKSGK
jgi:Arc/MetJ-type ribon-helix-helix transcriptional regulator